MESMRLSVVDLIKGISIIMIVNAHLISGPFFSIGCTFHVIAFFFASGIIHGMNQKWETLSLRDFLKRKAFRLLYPYVSLSICYICSRIILNFFRGSVIINDVITESLVKTITFRGIGTLWFLPVLFLGEMLFFMLKRSKICNYIIVVAGIVIIVISACLNKNGVCGLVWYGNSSLYGILVNNPLSLLLSSCIAVFFIELGYLSFQFFPQLFQDSLNNTSKIVALTILCVVSLTIDLFFVKYYTGDLHKLDIGSPFVYLICSISGLAFVTTFSIIINCCIRLKYSLLSFWGINSLIIMTTHSEYFINVIADSVVKKCFSLFSISHTATFDSGVSLVIIMMIETGIVVLINHSFLRFLFSISPPKERQF